MPTREIPVEQWTEFFDGFSRMHEGWLVTIEILGAMGTQSEARELPLRAVTADGRGSREAISIIVGSHEQTLTHAVPHPRHVRLEQTDEGADEALQIEAEDGEITLLRFRSAVLPEMVDGVLPPRTTK